MKTSSICTLSLAALLSLSLYGAETDQFYASGATIKDSSAEMNNFFHGRIEFALSEVNKENPDMNCRLVAKEVLDHVLGKFSLVHYIKERDFSKVSVFTQTSPLIDRFPDESISDHDYRKHSIYENRTFPSNLVGIARTLNLNGVYIGTDKMGHFSIIGRTYYKNFLKALDDGLSEEEAQKKAIQKGFKQEVAFLGYTVGGTFSYGDLEANYQGLQFGRNMCEGENPYLVKAGSLWVHNPKNQFDIKTYINPKFDEAYNVSFWSPGMWKRMSKEIKRDYCKNNADKVFQARYKSYQSFGSIQNFNDEMIAEFLKEKPKFDRQKQLLGVDCQKL
ncbi:MAG: hypothetical protein K2Q18_07795 [Bdellovibrionales bacterium]|nr:hypothetical protein [Bdellovibrionales bacterium]